MIWIIRSILTHSPPVCGVTEWVMRFSSAPAFTVSGKKRDYLSALELQTDRQKVSQCLLDAGQYRQDPRLVTPDLNNVVFCDLLLFLIFQPSMRKWGRWYNDSPPASNKAPVSSLPALVDPIRELCSSLTNWSCLQKITPPPPRHFSLS